MQVKIDDLSKESDEKSTVNAIRIEEYEKQKDKTELHSKTNIEMNARIQALAKENEQLKESTKSANTSLELLRKKLNDSFTKASNSNKEQTSTLLEYKKNAEIVIEDLKKQIKDAKEQAQKYVIQEQEITQQLQQLKIASENKGSDIKMKCSQLELQLQKANSEIAHLKQTIEAKSNAKTIKEEELAMQIDYTKKLNDQLTQTNHSLKQEIEKYEDQVAQLNDQIKKQQLQIYTKNELLEKPIMSPMLSPTSDEKLSEELAIKDKLLSQQTDQIAALQKELMKMQRQTINASEILQSKESLVMQIKELQKQMLSRDEEYQKELQTLRGENSTLRTNSKKSPSDNGEVHKMEIMKLKEQVGLYEEKNMQLEAELVTAKGEIAKSSSLSDARDEIRNLQVSYNELEKKYLEARKQSNSANDGNTSVDTLISQNKKYIERISDLENDLLISKQQLAEAFNKLNE